MTDSVMTYIPTHLRHLPFDLAFTLNADDDLMCVRLREDQSFSRDLNDYEMVCIEDGWSDEDIDTLHLIYDTLMGAA